MQKIHSAYRLLAEWFDVGRYRRSEGEEEKMALKFTQKQASSQRPA